jgi:hypothetical protein
MVEVDLTVKALAESRRRAEPTTPLARNSRGIHVLLRELVGCIDSAAWKPQFLRSLGVGE